jgi:hypothetical protein
VNRFLGKSSRIERRIGKPDADDITGGNSKSSACLCANTEPESVLLRGHSTVTSNGDQQCAKKPHEILTDLRTGLFFDRDGEIILATIPMRNLSSTFKSCLR